MDALKGPVVPLVPVGKETRKIRKLPRSIIKAGQYGPEYEEWKREQEELERKALEEALTPLPVANSNTSQGSAVMQPMPTPTTKKAPKKVKTDRIRVEVVERGVPKRDWFLIKWLVKEEQAKDGDSIVLFKEEIRESNEEWSLTLHHKKSRGSTHCEIASWVKIGRLL